MQDLYDYLREFDRKRDWNRYEKKMGREEKLQYVSQLLVGLMGELGEFANEVKKSHRDSVWKEQELKEELTDTFVFLLKLSLALDMDLKQEFYKKMKRNEDRFKHFVNPNL